MLGPLKNASSIKIPNFSQQKRKMPKIKFFLDRKMHPLIESWPSLFVADGLWRENEKVIIPSVCNCTMSSSQVSSDTMLDFYHSSQHYDLGIFNSENNMHSNKHKRQETQRIFLRETIKEKTPQLPQRYNQHQNRKSQNIKVISIASISLSLTERDSPLSLMRPNE